jgi:hypothetical protein
MKVISNLDSITSTKGLTSLLVTGDIILETDDKLRLFINGEPTNYTTSGDKYYTFSKKIPVDFGHNTIQITAKAGSSFGDGKLQFSDTKYCFINYRVKTVMVKVGKVAPQVNGMTIGFPIPTYKYQTTRTDNTGKVVIEDIFMVHSSVCDLLGIESMFSVNYDGWFTMTLDDNVVSLSNNKYVHNNIETITVYNNMEIKDNDVFVNANSFKIFGINVIYPDSGNTVIFEALQDK